MRFPAGNQNSVAFFNRYASFSEVWNENTGRYTVTQGTPGAGIGLDHFVANGALILFVGLDELLSCYGVQMATGSNGPGETVADGTEVVRPIEYLTEVLLPAKIEREDERFDASMLTFTCFGNDPVFDGSSIPTDVSQLNYQEEFQLQNTDR